MAGNAPVLLTPTLVTSRHPTSRKYILSAIAGLLVVALGGATLVYQRHRTAEIAERALPAVPPAVDRQPELAERLQSTTEQVRAGRQPVEGLSQLARLYYANGFYTEAQSVSQALQTLAPDDARWSYLSAVIFSSFGNLDDALPLLSATREKAPDYEPAQLRLADTLRKANRSAEALAVSQDLVARAPSSPRAWLNLARSHVDAQAWDKAVETLRRALQLDGDAAAAWSLLSTALEQTGAHEEALRAKNRASRLPQSSGFPDPWLDATMDDCFDVYRLRVAAAARPTSEDAARWLERAVRLSPNDASANRDLGKLLFERGQQRRGLEHLQKATQLEPADSTNWLTLAASYAAQKNHAAHFSAINSGLTQCPSSGALHLERGRALSSQGENDRALADFAASKRLNPKQVDAYIETGLVHLKRTELDEARAELLAALELEPDHPFALLTLARFTVIYGEEKEAHALVERVARHGRILDDDLNKLKSDYASVFGKTFVPGPASAR